MIVRGPGGIPKKSGDFIILSRVNWVGVMLLLAGLPHRYVMFCLVVTGREKGGLFFFFPSFVWLAHHAPTLLYLVLRYERPDYGWDRRQGWSRISRENSADAGILVHFCCTGLANRGKRGPSLVVGLGC